MTATCKRQETPAGRAEHGLRNGYKVYDTGGDRYLVVRPDGQRYQVQDGRCSCPASVPCKHAAMVELLLDVRAAKERRERRRRASNLLDEAAAFDGLASDEMVWDRGSRFTDAGLRFRAEAVRLYDMAYWVRFGQRRAA
jgi:hypothetical protein